MSDSTLTAFNCLHLQNKDSYGKRIRNGSPCKFSPAEPKTISLVAHCHCTTTPEKRRWVEEKPSHTLCVRMRLEVEPAFLLFSSRQRAHYSHLMPPLCCCTYCTTCSDGCIVSQFPLRLLFEKLPKPVLTWAKSEYIIVKFARHKDVLLFIY